MIMATYIQFLKKGAYRVYLDGFRVSGFRGLTERIRGSSKYRAISKGN